MTEITTSSNKPEKLIAMAFVLITLLFFLILIGYSLGFKENSDRIRAIEENRVYSCKFTYLAIKEAFQPLIPLNPTYPQQTNVNEFNKIIAKLIKGCDDQTNPAGL